MPVPPSPFKRHKAKWSNCTDCPLCEHRRNVVFCRGHIPADILFIGEAPGACIAGGTLIDTAFRNKLQYPDGVPIRDLVGKSGFKVYSFDVASGSLALGTVRRVWKTGVKKLYRVHYFWWGARPDGSGGRHKYYGHIDVTDNHPFLLKSGAYRSIEQGLTVGSRLQPFYRRSGKYHYVGVSSGTLKKESRFLTEHTIGRPLVDGEEVHHDDRNKWNDSEENLVLTDTVSHARLHGLEDNAMFDPVHRAAHAVAVSSAEYRRSQSQHMRSHLADPEAYARRVAQIHSQRDQTSATVKQKFDTDPVYYFRYLRGRKFRNGLGYSESRLKEKFLSKFPDVEYPPEENHQVFKIERLKPNYVYDMEVEKYHNFAANGVFVHNSEDVIGQPFVGPAGKLLDRIIAEALNQCGHEVDTGGFDPQGHPISDWAPAELRTCFTNLVACIPRGEDYEKTTEPPRESIKACEPRLVEFVRICKPRLIVCVGALAKKYIHGQAQFALPHEHDQPHWLNGEPMLFTDITHPAAILRSNVAMRGLMVQKATVVLAEAVAGLSG